MTVRLIGMLFGGKWFSLCNKCGERTDAMTEHILSKKSSAQMGFRVKFVLARDSCI